MEVTIERIRRVKLRVRELNRIRINRLISGLSLLCSMLAISLIGSIGLMIGGGQNGGVQGLYGSMMLYEDAGGYVLVGVLALTAGVVITALGIRYMRRGEKHKDEEKGSVK